MRKQILFILVILLSEQGLAQNTWFKMYDRQTFGYTSNNLLLQDDTLVHVHAFYNFDINGSDVAIDLLDAENGELFSSDSLTYSRFSNNLYTPNHLIRNQDKQIEVAFSMVDTAGPHYWSVFVYNLNDKTYKPCNTNIDTLDSSVTGLFAIDEDEYILAYYATRDKGRYDIWKIYNDSFSIIYSSSTYQVCASCHKISFTDLQEDNQSSGSLFLTQLDQWMFSGNPANWEVDILKLDTAGNVIWKCRPNTRDTFNTTFPKMVQKPNGNLLVMWNDQYIKEGMNKAGTNYYEELNDDMTLWITEIDYKTGEVLWSKDLYQYLSRKTNVQYQYINIKYAKLQPDNSIIWVGDLSAHKSFPVMLKTDLEGNPIWYRQYEIYPDDSGDKGMNAYSFVRTSDGGFIIAGEYENRFGEMTGGVEHWQRPALLKVDEYGCYEPGCQETDGMSSRQAIYKLCKIYPNPASDIVHIELPANHHIKDYTIFIHSYTGQKIRAVNTESIDISQVPVGIYFIQITNKKTRHYETHKIIIEH